MKKSRKNMCQLDRLQQLKEEILQIARKHNAEKVYVFGSCARKEETPESDVDFASTSLAIGGNSEIS